MELPLALKVHSSPGCVTLADEIGVAVAARVFA